MASGEINVSILPKAPSGVDVVFDDHFVLNRQSDTLTSTITWEAIIDTIEKTDFIFTGDIEFSGNVTIGTFSLVGGEEAFLKKGKTDEIFAASAEVKGVGVGF